MKILSNVNDEKNVGLIFESAHELNFMRELLQINMNAGMTPIMCNDLVITLNELVGKTFSAWVQDDEENLREQIKLLQSQVKYLVKENESLNLRARDAELRQMGLLDKLWGHGLSNGTPNIKLDENSALKPSVDKKINDIFSKSVDELKLPVRAANCLKAENIYFIGDLVSKSEPDILHIYNLGKKSFNDIKQCLDQLGLRFGMDINWESPE